MNKDGFLPIINALIDEQTDLSVLYHFSNKMASINLYDF